VEPREEDKQEPKAPEPREEQPRPRRFRIVKLEERVAPLTAKGPPMSYPSVYIQCI
jgi:hypothetical protein